MRFLSSNKYHPMNIWAATLIAASAAWSFHLVSFLDAKGIVLAVGLCFATILQALSGRLSGKGFQLFLPLWAGLLAWILMGLFTAQVPFYLIEKAIFLGILLTAASIAAEAFGHPKGRVWLLRSVIASGTLVGTLALLQYFSMIDFLFPVFPAYTQRAYSVFGNQNLLGGYVALCIPPVLSKILRPRKILICKLLFYSAVFSILLGALVVSSTRSAWLAAAVGCIWVITGRSALKKYRRTTALRWPQLLVLFVPLVLIVAASAPLIHSRLNATFSDDDIGGNSRIWFWAGACCMVRENFLFGVGLGNFAFWSPYYQGKALEAWGNDALYHNELHTVHAHSEPLEMAAESGIIGCLFILWFILPLLRRHRHETPALLTLAVFSCFNTISHSPSHLFAGLLLAGSVLVQNRTIRKSGRSANCLIPCTAVLLFTVGYVFTAIIPSALLNHAEQTHIRGGAPEPLYLRALHWPWPNPQAQESYAILLMDEGRYDAAWVHLEYAAEGIDTGRIHLLQAVCADAAGDKITSTYHANECLYRWPDNAKAKTLVSSSIRR